MSCSLKQSQALNNYKNTITDFNGLTLLERQRNFKDYNPNQIDPSSKAQLLDASGKFMTVTEPVEPGYGSSVE